MDQLFGRRKPVYSDLAQRGRLHVLQIGGRRPSDPLPAQRRAPGSTGHYIYLRDDDTGEYWSISWQPVGKDFTQAKYETRHGLSYSKFSCDYQGIAAAQTLFIPLGDDVELWDVVVGNKSGRPRRLSVFSYVEFSYGHVAIDNQNFQMSLYASGSSYHDGVIEYDFFYEPDTFRFMTANFAPDSYDCATASSAHTARRATRWRWNAARAATAPN